MNVSGNSRSFAESAGGPSLVVGWGNDLRGDDAAGLRVADAVAAWRRPGVSVLARRQLTPELAEALAAVRRVIFVDACLRDDAAGSAVRVERVSAASGGDGEPAPVLGHHGSPGSLLRLAAVLYGVAPDEAWLVRIPAGDFTLGAALSEQTERGIQAATVAIAALLDGAQAPAAAPVTESLNAHAAACSRPVGEWCEEV